MRQHMQRGSGHGRMRAFLWGAAHALDLGGVLRARGDWRGLESDAEAIGQDWKAAIGAAQRQAHVSEEEREEE